MTLVERMLRKFSPPLDSSLIISLSSELPDSIENELILLETLSNLIQDTLPSGIPSQAQNACSSSLPRNHDSNHYLIHQVQSIFPNLSESLIQRAISHNNSSDLNDIIDYLQATEYEDQDPASLSSPDRSISTQISTKKNKKNKKPLTIHLNDVLQREPAARLKEFQQAQATNDVNNAWVTGDSQIIYLSNLLGIEAGKIHSTYHSKACNLTLTLEEIFSRLETSKRIQFLKDQDGLEQLKVQLDFLRTMLSNNDDETLTRLLILTDLDPGNAYDLWLFLDDLQDRCGTLPFNQFFFSNPHPSSNLVDKKNQPNLLKNITINDEISDGDMNIQVSQPSEGTSKNVSGHSLNHCSTKLNELGRAYEEKKQFMKNPSILTGPSGSNNKVHINKRVVQNSIALIHREGANKIWNQLKEWEFELVKAVVLERQRARNDLNSIDLHGLTTNQASYITSEYLSAWWNHTKHLANAYNSQYEPFRIVTGAGTHSVDSKPRVLHTITRLLDAERWKWKIEDTKSGVIGSLIVYGKKK